MSWRGHRTVDLCGARHRKPPAGEPPDSCRQGGAQRAIRVCCNTSEVRPSTFSCRGLLRECLAERRTGERSSAAKRHQI